MVIAPKMFRDEEFKIPYDYFLDQNAGYYGYKHAAQPLHIQLNLVDTTICVINTLAKERRDLIVKSVVYDIHGKKLSENSLTLTVPPNSVITKSNSPLFPNNLMLRLISSVM